MRAAFPSRLCIIILASPCLLSFLLIFNAELLNGILILDAALLILIFFDLFIGRIRKQDLQIELEIPSTWSLGRKENIYVRCTYTGKQTRLGRIRLDLPSIAHAEPEVLALTFEAQKKIEICFPVSADVRGRLQIHGVHIELRSSLGLWNIHYRHGDTHTVSIYPNIKQISDYALLARTNRLSLIGVRKIRSVGGDTDFERLRDYQSGDSVHSIDWKASARRDELTVRDYQPNQSQTIMLMIDAGRMMVTKTTDSGEQNFSMLDHAINASLLLAYVAIKQGDRVGVIAYANGIKRYVPAAGGEKHIHTLIHALHDVQAELVESRHEEAFLHVQKMERKRSLVILFSHVLDDVNAMHIEQHCQKLVGRHLPLAVLLRDQSLHQHLEQAPQNSDEFWKASAAAHICNNRQSLIDRLRAHGSLVLDTDPNDLNAGIITRYLELKAKHLL